MKLNIACFQNFEGDKMKGMGHKAKCIVTELSVLTIGPSTDFDQWNGKPVLSEYHFFFLLLLSQTVD